MRLPDEPSKSRDEIRRELEAHLAERTDELTAEGWSPDEARERAELEFGSARIAEARMMSVARRERHRSTLVGAVSGGARDVGFAVRSLLKAPTFAVMAAAAVAIGVGSSTAVWSVVDGVLLRPLPYPEPDELVTLWSVPPQRDNSSPSWPDFQDWQAGSSSFAHMAFIRGQTLTHIDAERGAAAIATAWVSPEFVDVVSPPTHLGSLAPLGDPRPTENVIVLKHSLWQSRFGGDSAVVGQVIPFASGGYRVAAVLAPGVDYPLWADAYVRLDEAQIVVQGLGDRAYRLDTRVVARLGPDASLEGARSEIRTLADRLAEDHPATNAGWSASVEPLSEVLLGPVERPLWILLAAVGGLLLIACINVASLSLARTLDRLPELGLRAALGAGGARLVRLLMVESMMVAVVGGAVGVILARWGVRAFLAWGVPGLPRTQQITVDARVMAFALVAAAAAGVLSGLIPAAMGARTSLGSLLRRSTSSVGPQRLRGILVGGQLALTLVLVAATGLLARSLQALHAVDGGVNPSGLATLRVTLPANYTANPPLRAAFFQKALEELQARPGVAAATLVNHVPLSGTGVLTPLRVEGVEAEDAPQAWLRTAGPDFFEVVGLPMLAGRALNSEDHRRWTGAVVVSEVLARQLWGEEDPLGRPLTLFRQVSSDADYGAPLEGRVVGVAANTRTTLRAGDPTPAVYVPMSVHPWPSAYLVARPRAGVSVIDDLRQVVSTVDPAIPVAEVVGYEALSRFSVARDRFLTTLTGVFAAMALLLSLVGTYGALAYAVRCRSRELAMRMALGASRPRLAREVFTRAARLVGAGVLVGIAGSLLLTRFMGSVLYQVSPLDPLALGGAVVLLAVIGLVGAWVPAHRAARTDPMHILRE